MRASTVGFIVAMLLLTAQAGAQTPSTKDGSSKEPTPKKVDKVDGRTLDEWIKLLKSEDPSRRTQAIIAITQFEEDAARAVPILITIIRSDTDVSPRVKAVHVMRFIEINDKDVPEVIRALYGRLVLNPSTGQRVESQVVIRFEALMALRRFTSRGRPAITALISATRDQSSWELRQVAVSNLWRVAIEDPEKDAAGPDPRIVNALLDVVTKQRSYQVQMEALRGLAYLGKPADNATQERLIKDLNLIVRGPSAGVERSVSIRTKMIWALAALSRMGENPGTVKAPLNILASYLNSKDLELKRQAAAAMSALGPAAKPKLKELMKLLDDPEPLAVIAGAEAILATGDKSTAMIDRLLKLVDDKEPRNIVTAVGALVVLKQNTKDVHKALENVLARKDVKSNVKMIVEDAIKQLKKADAPKKP